MIFKIRMHFEFVRLSISAVMEKLRELNISPWLSVDQCPVVNSLLVKWQSLIKMAVSTE